MAGDETVKTMRGGAGGVREKARPRLQCWLAPPGRERRERERARVTSLDKKKQSIPLLFDSI
eukprot:scaffold105751_cov39-Tisochrysis_lutea.AAC.1